jgi:hypothetical protein
MARAALPAIAMVAMSSAMVACNSDARVLGPTPNNVIFTSFVALGNSLTAGFQSGGINDSTQKQSYAVLLAKQMGTRFAYPALSMPGCPPPLNNLLTGTRVGGSTAPPCSLRTPASVTALLNNVAVPGIATADPTALGTNAPNNNALMQLFLGGETMVQKALDNSPTFATVWIGNNDILGPALSGFPSQATPVATFITNYAKDINTLVAGARGLKGVLIGVVQVAGAPILFQAGLLLDPTVNAAASLVAGRPVTLDPHTCVGAGLTSLVNLQYIVAIRSRPGAPANGTVFCEKVAGGGPTDPGDNGILDPAEQATVLATINAYNTYIHAKADSIGFAYYDPNPLLAQLRSTGAIPPFPNLLSVTAPFGPNVSLDGVHPTGATHILIANQLIGVINSKYGTTIPNIPTS